MDFAPIVDDVSGRIRNIELAWIPMSDGRRLAARLWLPADANTRNDGSASIDDIDTTISYGKVKEFSIARNDPETNESVISTTMHYRRAGWDARLETRIRMRSSRDHFFFDSDVDAFEGGERCFSRSFAHKIPRDNL